MGWSSGRVGVTRDGLQIVIISENVLVSLHGHTMCKKGFNVLALT